MQSKGPKSGKSTGKKGKSKARSKSKKKKAEKPPIDINSCVVFLSQNNNKLDRNLYFNIKSYQDFD